MDGVYVLCVVLTLHADSVCWEVPSEKACEQKLDAWLQNAVHWREVSHATQSYPLGGCMTRKHFLTMGKTLFTIGDTDQKSKSIENVK